MSIDDRCQKGLSEFPECDESSEIFFRSWQRLCTPRFLRHSLICSSCVMPMPSKVGLTSISISLWFVLWMRFSKYAVWWIPNEDLLPMTWMSVDSKFFFSGETCPTPVLLIIEPMVGAFWMINWTRSTVGATGSCNATFIINEEPDISIFLQRSSSGV